jgi:hypothetical protein
MDSALSAILLRGDKPVKEDSSSPEAMREKSSDVATEKINEGRSVAIMGARPKAVSKSRAAEKG